jgi:hypothetical protein
MFPCMLHRPDSFHSPQESVKCSLHPKIYGIFLRHRQSCPIRRGAVFRLALELANMEGTQ